VSAKEGSLKRFGHWVRDQPRLSRMVAVGWVIYLASQANIVRLLGSTAERLVALQTATSHARVIEVLAAWTAEDRAHFAAHLPFDLAHALIYPVVLVLSLALGFRAAGVPRRFDGLLCLPFLAGALDEVENFAHHVAVQAAPDVPFWAFAVGSPASILKWTIAFTALLALPALIVARLKRGRPAPPSEGVKEPVS